MTYSCYDSAAFSPEITVQFNIQKLLSMLEKQFEKN